MTEIPKISAVIITKNEEENIRRCISSVKPLVDEILVVDSFSTDNTVLIAQEMGARTIQHQFMGHIEQKNFAVMCASNNLILSLDADEALSEILYQNIEKLLNHSCEIKAVRFSRVNFYLGKWIRHSGWYPDKKVRLFDRRVASWGGINPHDKVIVDSRYEIVEVEGDILHRSYKDLQSHLNRIDEYSTIAARQKLKSGKSMNLIVHLVLYPMWVFINTYLFKLGFLDGYHGFLISRLNAYYRFQKYLKLYRVAHLK